MKGALAKAVVACCLVLPASPAAAQVPARDALAQRVDRYLQPYLDLAAFSGVVLLARHGNILLERAYGMANYELGVPIRIGTRFHIASVSKTFTAAAVLQLVERGKIRIRDPIAKFVPDYPRGNEITVHHLLAHASGIPDVNGLPGYDTIARLPHTTASLVALFRDQPLDFVPGSRYSYSNSNYNLLAYIIEHVSGMGYGEFLEQNIFRPAGLTSTAVPLLDGRGSLPLGSGVARWQGVERPERRPDVHCPARGRRLRLDGGTAPEPPSLPDEWALARILE